MILAATGAFGRTRKLTDDDVRLVSILRIDAVRVALAVRDNKITFNPLSDDGADGGRGLDHWLDGQSGSLGDAEIAAFAPIAIAIGDVELTRLCAAVGAKERLSAAEKRRLVQEIMAYRRTAERIYLACEFARARWAMTKQSRPRDLSAEVALRIRIRTEALRGHLFRLASYLSRTLPADDVCRTSTLWPTEGLVFVKAIEDILRDAEGEDHKTMPAVAALLPIVKRSQVVLGISLPRAEGLIAELADVDASMFRKKRPKKQG